MLSRYQLLTCCSDSARFQRRHELSCAVLHGPQACWVLAFQCLEMLVTVHTVLILRTGLVDPCYCNTVQTVAEL